VPVPRRFDRRLPERDQTRINDRIRVPEVRLVGEDGKQIGVIKTADALAYAQQRDLDLVEVAPEARPPVCRVLDYSKYKYEQAQKQKAARRHQQQITIREIKFRPKIAQADYDTKKGHVERFLRGRDKVKVTIMFRGREVTHPERGVALLQKLAGELGEVAVIEQSPLQDGRNMTMLLAPGKAVATEEEHQQDHDHDHDGHAARGEGKSSRRNRAAAEAAELRQNGASANGSAPSEEPGPASEPAPESRGPAAAEPASETGGPAAAEPAPETRPPASEPEPASSRATA
jgi:translation initiation factor IF-3